MINFTDATGGAPKVEIQLPPRRIGGNVMQEPIPAPDNLQPGNAQSEWQALLAQVGILRGADVDALKGRGSDLSGAEAEASSIADTSGEKPAYTIAFGVAGEELKQHRHLSRFDIDMPARHAPAAEATEEPASPLKVIVKYGVARLRATETEKDLLSSKSRPVLRSERRHPGKQLAFNEGTPQQTSAEPVFTDLVLTQGLSAPGEAARSASTGRQTDPNVTGDRGVRTSLAMVADRPEQASCELPEERGHRQPNDAKMVSTAQEIEGQTVPKSHDAVKNNPPKLTSADSSSLGDAPSRATASKDGAPTCQDTLGISLQRRNDSSVVYRPSFPVGRHHTRKSNAQEFGPAPATGAASTASMLNSPARPFADVCADGPRGPLQTKSVDAAGVIDQSTRTMDRSSKDPEQRWTHVESRVAEAGFQDPTLGWVSVRAERNSTGLHAVLVPASHDAGKMLSAHLSGLNAHLASQHIEVSSVTMSSELKNQMSSSFGNDSQQQTSENQGRQHDRRPQGRDSRGLDAAAISHSTPWSGGLNRYEGAPLRYGAHGVQGTHVSLVA